MRWRDRYPRESTCPPPQQDRSVQPGSLLPGATLVVYESCPKSFTFAVLCSTVEKAVIPLVLGPRGQAPAQMLHSHSESELGPH